MATTVIQTSVAGVLDRPRLSLVQSYFVRRSHPASLFVEAAGASWIIYFFWNHLWVESLLVLLFSRVIANFIAFRANPEVLAQSSVGRIALLHAQPINMLIQLVGLVGFFYGLWTHEVKVILMGISIVMLGHLVGWHRVDRHFELS